MPSSPVTSLIEVTVAPGTGLPVPFAADAILNDALDESPFTTVSSTKVFHSWHPGHCPIHFADSKPQLWQKYTLVCFALAIKKLCPGYLNVCLAVSRQIKGKAELSAESGLDCAGLVTVLNDLIKSILGKSEGYGYRSLSADVEFH